MTEMELFADDLLYGMLQLSPDLAAELGITAVGERRLPTNTLVDFGESAAAERHAFMARQAEAFDRLSGRDGADRLTWRILHYLLNHGAFGLYAGRDGRDFAEMPYPVNHLTGWHPTIAMLLVRDHPVQSVEDAQDYLDRLGAIPSGIEQLIEAARARVAEGIVIPRSSLVKAIADVRAFVDTPPADNALVASFGHKARSTLDAKTATAWLSRAEAVFAATVRPAYTRLLASLEAELLRAIDSSGVWKLPNGDAYYAWQLRAHTTTDMSPGSVHQLGLQEVPRLQATIRRDFHALGLSGQSITDLYQQIAGPGFRAFPADADRGRVLADTRALVADLEHRSVPLLNSRPREPVEVALVPPAFEDTQHTRYTPPMPTSQRPGTFSLNFGSVRDRSRWELPVICAHEGAPGHHTQLALAQDLPLCAFRRAIVFTAYIEGWAKYAETLLDRELMDDPYVRLGRLRGELYSTVNLVLDTGVHAYRWSREQASRYFCEQTGVEPAFAESIVDRGLVTPGQLCAYKIGMRKFLELRDMYQQHNAGLPGLRRFHDTVLGQGSVPLHVLDDVVRTFVGAQKPASGELPPATTLSA